MANIDTKVVKTDELRITKLRTYLFKIIDTLLTDNKYLLCIYLRLIPTIY